MCGDNSKISGIVAHKRIVPNTPSFFLTDSATKEIIIGANCTDCNRGNVVVEPSIDETKVSEKKMWVENHKKRFAITPVTAAETIESVYSNLGCCVIQSTQGAPKNIHKKQINFSLKEFEPSMKKLELVQKLAYDGIKPDSLTVMFNVLKKITLKK